MHTDLDHVALATRDAAPVVHLFAGAFGGTILFGGQGPGFRPMQILLGDESEGMRVELLEPWDTDRNDFLERFLARHGDGPHHLTFKVDSLDSALEACAKAGLTPVNINRSDPTWQEAFLMPREAHGTVVQFAQTRGDFPDRAQLLDHVRRNGPETHPQWWPDPVAPEGPVRPAVLDRVVVRTPVPEEATAFFSDFLGGRVETERPGGVDLAWPGGGRIRLATDADQPPGVSHLVGRIAGDATTVEVAGTRLVLESR